jgi:DNA invertase Pin-like site-specific DNA recombinase
VQQGIAYYRVSTQRQGESGFGLEAQRATVERFAVAEGFTLANSFVEVESGADDDRPQLMAALAEARRLKCPLMIAKLDRLSRDTHFVTGLLKHGKVQIVIAELGLRAEPFIIEIMAAVASQERRMISRRTKEALAAAKARGVKLGGYRHDGSISKSEALERAEALRSTFDEMRSLSHRGVARALNDRGVKTAQGGPRCRWRVCAGGSTRHDRRHTVRYTELAPTRFKGGNSWPPGKKAIAAIPKATAPAGQGSTQWCASTSNRPRVGTALRRSRSSPGRSSRRMSGSGRWQQASCSNAAMAGPRFTPP